MTSARFTYSIATGVLGRGWAVENFLRGRGWQKKQTQSGEVVAIVINRRENGEIRWITFTFCGQTFTEGEID